MVFWQDNGPRESSTPELEKSRVRVSQALATSFAAQVRRPVVVEEGGVSAFFGAQTRVLRRTLLFARLRLAPRRRQRLHTEVDDDERHRSRARARQTSRESLSTRRKRGLLFF